MDDSVDGHLLHYQQLYNKSSNKEEFCKELIDNVIQGREREEATLAQLKVLESQGQEGQDLLRSLPDDSNDTILNLAAKFHEDTKILKHILHMCPTLVLQSRKGYYEGQTTLHIVVSKRNHDAIKALFKTHIVKKFKIQLLKTVATGSRFEHTVMMGELPFSVAALTLDMETLKLMLKNGTDDMISYQNSYGDTVFHSLIKYSYLHPDKVPQIIEVFSEINKHLAERPSDEVLTKSASLHLDKTDPVGIWFLRNYNLQTPLQLAASLEQVELFKFILNIEGVYCRLDCHDGLFDIQLYDITEIETVTMSEFIGTSLREKKKKSSRVAPTRKTDMDLPQKNVNNPTTRFSQPGNTLKHQKHKPILETICEIRVQKAFQLVNIKVIRTIIKKKWTRYSWMYFIWAFVHIVYMTVLTWSAVVKTEILKHQTTGTTGSNTGSNTSYFQCVYACVQGSSNSDVQADQIYPTNGSSNYDQGYRSAFILGMNILNIMTAAVIAGFEIRRRLWQGYKFHLKQLHHNGSYRLILCLFAVCLFVDSVWYLISPSNNFLLVLALLVGWWFLTFFLRAIKKFSFFTVMLQKVLMGDAVRFFVIIIIEFLSFTIAMYITFLYTQPEGFGSIGDTFLTLFNLMLGLTELSILTQARDPWLAILLFVLFVLVTYVLMLNALIAMMSQTCAVVSENKRVQGELQRLSVILFLESILPHCAKVCCGTSKYVKRYDLTREKMVQEKRYFLEMDSLQTSYSKGTSIIKQRSMIQTRQFDNTVDPDDLHRFVREFLEQYPELHDSYESFSGRKKGRSSKQFLDHPFPREGGLSPSPQGSRGKSPKTNKSSIKKISKETRDRSESSQITPGMEREKTEPDRHVAFKESCDIGFHRSAQLTPEISPVKD